MTAVKKIDVLEYEQPTIKRILDAAENQFAELGYAATGMKAIALEAGVAQGLLHYHFGNKDSLYEAVIARRAAEICHVREEILDSLDLEATGALEKIFDAFLRPIIEDPDKGRAYTIINSGRYVGKLGEDYLVNKYYDATAIKFIEAILKAAPGATREIAVWSYLNTLSAMVSTTAQDGRRERLIGVPRPEKYDADSVVRMLVLSAVGGLRSMIAAREEREV